MVICTEDILTAPENETVCFCRQITKGDYLHLIRQGTHDLDSLKRITGADGKQCADLSPKGRCCTPEIVRLLRHEKGMLPID